MASHVSISPLCSEESKEAAALIKLVIESLSYYNERARAEELAKYTAQALVESITDDPLSVLVARDGGRLTGFCISKYDDGVIWLSWFGTHPNYRGHGLGRQMLESLAATLSKRRAHKIWCDTRTENMRSQDVLKKFGFVRIVELRNHWYGQDFYLWEWYP